MEPPRVVEGLDVVEDRPAPPRAWPAAFRRPRAPLGGVAMSVHTFSEYFLKFEKMQTWIFHDLTLATTKAQANFLVAMALFNYIEILGGFCLPKSSPAKERFDFVFKNLLSNPYRSIYNELDKLTTKGAYDCLRCGMTHEYLVKTYTLKNKTLSIGFTVYGVDDEAAYTRNVLAKDCGLELVELEKDRYRLCIYNPRLIYDLHMAFEEFKKRLISDDPGFRRNFVDRCGDVNLGQLT